jgi:hypothetical protein
MAVVDPTTLWRRTGVQQVEQCSSFLENKLRCYKSWKGIFQNSYDKPSNEKTHTKLECDLLCLRFKTCIFQGKMVQLDRIRIDIVAKLHPQSRRSYSCFNRFTCRLIWMSFLQFPRPNVLCNWPLPAGTSTCFYIHSYHI